MKIKPSYILLLLLCFILSCKKEKIKSISPVSIDSIKPATKSEVKVDKQLSEEEFIDSVVMAFKNKNEKYLNSLIDPEYRFYIIPGPGTLMHFDLMEKIEFSQAYLNYHNFGVPNGKLPKLQYSSETPQFDCETQKWDKYGLYRITGNIKVFENILVGQEMGQWEVNPDDRIIAKKLDPITKSVYFTEKDSDVIFGFAQVNGRYILIYVNVQPTYCDI